MAAYEKICYKETDGQKLYLYVFSPEHKPEKTPGILCIHGGGWERESPSILFRHAEFFAERGYTAICPQYRLMPSGGSLIDCLRDCIDAAVFVRKNAETLGVDRDAVAALGDSAGGYLACCLGCGKIVRRFCPDESVLVSKVIDLNGIVDLTGYWNYALGKNSTEDEQRKLSPLFNISKNDAPVFIMHGLSDSVVEVRDSERYEKALLQAGVRAEAEYLPSTEHAFILFGYRLSDGEIYALLEEIERHLS